MYLQHQDSQLSATVVFSGKPKEPFLAAFAGAVKTVTSYPFVSPSRVLPSARFAPHHCHNSPALLILPSTCFLCYLLLVLMSI